MKKVNILVADDHLLVREGIVNYLNSIKEYKIIGEAVDGEDAIRKAEILDPDIILMDIGMPKMNGLKATKNILKKKPDSKILVLSGHDEEEYVEEFMKSGAKGYILKNTSSLELVQAITSIINGNIFIDPGISQKLYSKALSPDDLEDKKHDKKLTTREIEILILIANGFMNKEIADKLDLSIKTVVAHRENIREKLDLHRTADLTRYAISKGYVKLNIS